MNSFAESAAEIAREAGSLLRWYFERGVQAEIKSGHDLITEADRASEKLVVERLTAAFPDHGIVAEEGGGHESASPFRWYLDPLDGTTNFAHSYPAWCVTMALEKAGTLVAGVVFDPMRNEMFTAEKGGGAFLNGRRIHVSKVSKVADGLACTGFPNMNREDNPNFPFFQHMQMAMHGVRRSGSAAFDLACTACGRLDMFWEFGLSPWDMAAGILLVEEAGGICSDMRGGPYDVRGTNILADNGRLHTDALAHFAEVFRGDSRLPIPLQNAQS